MLVTFILNFETHFKYSILTTFKHFKEFAAHFKYSAELLQN